MIRRRHLLYLLYTSSARPPAATPYFTAPPPLPSSLFPKGYGHESSNRKHVVNDEPITHEKAPTTLEEFKRLEEEKERQGVASQTVEKAGDGFMEAVADDDSLDSVKESFKEPPGVGNFRRTGD